MTVAAEVLSAALIVAPIAAGVIGVALLCAGGFAKENKELRRKLGKAERAARIMRRHAAEAVTMAVMEDAPPAETILFNLSKTIDLALIDMVAHDR